MKKLLVAGALGAAALVASGAAMAHVDVSLGIGVPVYSAPPPVVYAPPPPPPVYGPAYGPAVAVDYRGGYHDWHHHDYRDRNWHDRGWHGDHRRW
jgi:hypothetical protein